jgi:Ribbon-helix-helix protein, copG family
MRIPGPKIKLLTVRLSDTEYANLKRACEAEGWRSLSEFAREAILQRVQISGSSKASLAGDLHILGDQLIRVDEAIKNLSTRIERVLGKSPE